MACYHLHVDQIKRSEGRSSVACAAYRSGEHLYDDYYGEQKDYTRKRGVILSEIHLPPHAPKRFENRETLWNEVEWTEKNKKAQLAHSYDIALMNEFTMEENIAIVVPMNEGISRAFFNTKNDEKECMKCNAFDIQSQ